MSNHFKILKGISFITVVRVKYYNTDPKRNSYETNLGCGEGNEISDRDRNN